MCLSSHVGAQACAPATPLCSSCSHTLQQASNLKSPSSTTITIESDLVKTNDRDTVFAQGAVEITTPTEYLQANQAQYTHSTGSAQLSGDVAIHRGDTIIHSDQVNYNLKDKSGTFNTSRIDMPRRVSSENESNQIHASAQSISQNEHGLLTLTEANYTTCETPKPDWQLKASKLTLDKKKGVGTAKHVRVHVGNVPVFYWPYLSFPINDNRKTGFLFPSFNIKKRHGFAYTQPFYWNIRPNADATFTGIQTQKAGQGLRSQWRYLHALGAHGQAYYTLNADVHRDTLTHENRWYRQFSHVGQWNPRSNLKWSSYINLQRVSDATYLDHYENDAGVSNTDHLISEAYIANTVHYSHLLWQNKLGTQTHQTPDERLSNGSRPYDRAPYFESDLQSKDLPVHLQAQARWDSFKHISKINARRFNLYPSVSYPIERQAGFFIPKLGIQTTQYHFDGQKNIQRTTPIASIDTGLHFEKAYQTYTHRVSPRLYALYVPYKDQSNIPNFDTELRTFSYDALFAENRFTGLDKQGDAKQITLGLSNQWQDTATGLTRLSFDLARAFYDQSPKVGLNETITSTSRHSDIAARATLNATQALQFEANWQYSTEFTDFINHRYVVRYNPRSNLKLFTGFRQKKAHLNNTIDEEVLIDAGGHWRINPTWSIMGLGVYNKERQRIREIGLGIHYKSCCWGVDLIAQREISDTSATKADYSDSYYLQFSLDGLANVGRYNESLRTRIYNR